LSAGLTALVLLSVLADASDDLYGYEIARRLSASRTGRTVQARRALSRAAQPERSRPAVEPGVPSYAGPPRRYYRITPLGRDALAAWRATWTARVTFVDST